MWPTTHQYQACHGAETNCKDCNIFFVSSCTFGCHEKQTHRKPQRKKTRTHAAKARKKHCNRDHLPSIPRGKLKLCLVHGSVMGLEGPVPGPILAKEGSKTKGLTLSSCDQSTWNLPILQQESTWITRRGPSVFLAFGPPRFAESWWLGKTKNHTVFPQMVVNNCSEPHGRILSKNPQSKQISASYFSPKNHAVAQDPRI